MTGNVVVFPVDVREIKISGEPKHIFLVSDSQVLDGFTKVCRVLVVRVRGPIGSNHNECIAARDLDFDGYKLSADVGRIYFQFMASEGLPDSNEGSPVSVRTVLSESCVLRGKNFLIFNFRVEPSFVSENDIRICTIKHEEEFCLFVFDALEIYNYGS